MKTGECLEKYVVVKNEGSASHTSFSTDIAYYSLLIYVPKAMYANLDEYVLEVKEIMKKLLPMIKPAGNETPSFYDDAVNANMVSVMYKNFKKL